jgi:beta-N-acetylhexosaminidase
MTRERRELERLAATCLFAGFDGLTVPGWLRPWLEVGLGGVVLFARNVESREQLGDLTRALRAERPELLIAIDEEGGDVTRLEAETGSSYPGNHALGAVDDVGLTERVGAAMGAELANVGVNLNLAPVADLCVNHDNPIVGVRSFGSDPDLVARHVTAFVDGLQSVGVAACVKHFPGHGATEADSHLELPTVTGGLDDALVPFRAAVNAGARSIMTAHVRVPALGDEPATLSGEIVGGLLRDELGFQGMVVSDALEMGAIASTVGAADGAVRAILAGVDALCLGAELRPDAVHRAVVEQVPEERLREASDRVTATAAWAHGRVDGAVDREVGAEAAARALEVEGDVAVSGPGLVVELWPEASIAAGEARHGLGDSLRERDPTTEVLRLHGAADLPGPQGRSLVLVVRDAHRHDWQRAIVDSVDGAIVVETGLPVWRPNGASGYVATHGLGRVNLEAAAGRLSGR